MLCNKALHHVGYLHFSAETYTGLDRWHAEPSIDASLTLKFSGELMKIRTPFGKKACVFFQKACVFSQTACVFREILAF